jgi:hypothetical protein
MALRAKRISLVFSVALSGFAYLSCLREKPLLGSPTHRHRAVHPIAQVQGCANVPQLMPACQSGCNLLPKRARRQIMLVKHHFGHRIGRSVEPSLGFRLDARQCSVQGRVRAADLNAIDPDGDDRARANIGAAPMLNSSCRMVSQISRVIQSSNSAALTTRTAPHDSGGKCRLLPVTR